MTLLSTFWKTVYWKTGLFLYVAISLFFWISYDPLIHSLIVIIVADIALTTLGIMIIIDAWIGGFPNLWLFSKSVKCITPENYSFLVRMKEWCKENCNEKWRYCQQHGYFVFKEEIDAMAFMLRWA